MDKQQHRTEEMGIDRLARQLREGENIRAPDSLLPAVLARLGLPQKQYAQRLEVGQHLGQVVVARQGGSPPVLPPGQALVKMLAFGICGADVRVVTGKASPDHADHAVTLGHEGVGVVIDTGKGVVGINPGSHVAILPYVRSSADYQVSEQRVLSPIDPICIGSGQTLHMGWDVDGCFADFVTVPATNLVPVPSSQLHRARKLAPELGAAIFALVEPMLCVLSAYELMEIQLRAFQRRLIPGRALVVGCGPIGIMHSLTLLERGFEVWFLDSLQQREGLAQRCLNHRGHVFGSSQQLGAFDLVMVTEPSAHAIEVAEKHVRNGGIVYLFAGLNMSSGADMDLEDLFFYERLHRTARGILTTARQISERKSILYLGHSGYFERLAPKAVAAVAANAAALDSAVTGIVPGFASPRVVSRLPGGVDWTTEDASPAIVSILNGTDLRERHCKLLVLPDNRIEQSIPSQADLRTASETIHVSGANERSLSLFDTCNAR